MPQKNSKKKQRAAHLWTTRRHRIVSLVAGASAPVNGSAAGAFAARTLAAGSLAALGRSSFAALRGNRGRVAFDRRFFHRGRLGTRGLVSRRALFRGGSIAAATEAEARKTRSRRHDEQLVLQSRVHVVFPPDESVSMCSYNFVWHMVQRRAHPQQGATLPQS
jgi:hypothetical protein